MAIKIKIHNGDKSKVYKDPSDDPNFEGPTMEINVKKNIRGDYMIMDHADISVVYSSKEHNIKSFPKNVNIDADLAYDAQNRLYQFLIDKGVIDPESVQGGSLYSSMEADVFEQSQLQENQVVLFTIGKFIEQERPYFRWKEAFKEKVIDKYTDPDEEDSTDLGEVPHGDAKGSIDPSGWQTGIHYQMYEGKERESLQNIANAIYAKNKINMPSWAFLENGQAARIWDMPDSDLEMMVSYPDSDVFNIPMTSVKQIAWFDVDQYEENLPQTEPVDIMRITI
jgi:hypothetical protein